MLEITVLDKSNVPAGPFNRRQIADKLRTGEITRDQMAFTSQSDEQLPLRDLLARMDGNRNASSGRTRRSWGRNYAGFWRRCAAYGIDFVILIIPTVILLASIPALRHQGTGVDPMNRPSSGLSVALQAGLLLFSLTISWLYYALQESSSTQATVGKQIMGMKVIDLHGNRICFDRASVRFFGKILSSFILSVGYLMVAFTSRKQALHDMLADTLVVMRRAGS